MKKLADLNTYHSKKMLLGEAEKLVDYIFEQAKQGKATHQVEQGIFDRLLTMGHLALGQFIALQGDGDLGKQIELPSGKTVKRLPRPQKRAYRSIFGLYELVRVVYGSREGQKVEFVPLDNRL